MTQTLRRDRDLARSRLKYEIAALRVRLSMLALDEALSAPEEKLNPNHTRRTGGSRLAAQVGAARRRPRPARLGSGTNRSQSNRAIASRVRIRRSIQVFSRRWMESAPSSTEKPVGQWWSPAVTETLRDRRGPCTTNFRRAAISAFTKTRLRLRRSCQPMKLQRRRELTGPRSSPAWRPPFKIKWSVEFMFHFI